jgi:hypothetical protein
MPTCRISLTASASVPRRAKKFGLAFTTTREPSVTGGSTASNTLRLQVNRNEMSASVSRSVPNTVVVPRPIETSVSCPSTHTAPSWLIQLAIPFAIVRTAAGASGDVSKATPRPYDPPPTNPTRRPRVGGKSFADKVFRRQTWGQVTPPTGEPSGQGGRLLDA